MTQVQPDNVIPLITRVNLRPVFSVVATPEGIRADAHAEPLSPSRVLPTLKN